MHIIISILNKVKFIAAAIFLPFILHANNNAANNRDSTLFSGIIHVALISERVDAEIRTAVAKINQVEGISVTVITHKQSGRPGSLKTYDIVWIHRADSSELRKQERSEALITSLKKYVEDGGSLLLSQDGCRYLTLLGLENKPPELRNKPCIDEGYGRRLGFHAFLSHPVFQGMNGGAYVLVPRQDTKVRVWGYFGEDVIPAGRVVGVDWDYIFLREASKVIMEYRPGKGKVMAVGGYMQFTLPNDHAEHLLLFTKNTLRYLSGEKMDTPLRHWDFSPPVVSACQPEYALQPISYSPSVKWDIPSSPIDLTQRYATDDFWDVAGERMVLMGQQPSGIDEIWAHPFMALRNYEVSIKFSYRDTMYRLRDEKPEIQVTPDAFIRTYRFPRAYLKEVITVHPDQPVAVVHYEYHGVYDARLEIRFHSILRLMWPYSEKVLGNIQFTMDKGLNGFMIRDRSASFVCMLGANKRYAQQTLGPASNSLSPKEPPNSESGEGYNRFQSSGLFHVKLSPVDYFDVVIAASSEGIEKTKAYYEEALKNPLSVYKASQNHAQELLKNKMTVTTPDVDFNTGYRWAMLGTDRFFVHTPGIGKSLVAGYATTKRGWDGAHKVNGRPGYAWYFGRDGVWSAFALLGYGDFEKVREILKTYCAFQDLDGKVYHELSTGGIVHYDAADATPLFLILAGRYYQYSGDSLFIREIRQPIRKAMAYCFSTDTDQDHLIENTNVGHGWIEGGRLFGCHSTLYLSSLWAEALAATAFLCSSWGESEDAALLKKESDEVKMSIDQQFWDKEGQYFYEGKFRDGTFMKEFTIQNSIPLYLRQVKHEKSKPILEAFAGLGFTSDWGCRMIPTQSPHYRPNGYHDGNVWPLFTGWTALAEYAQNRPVQGYSHIMNNLQNYRHRALGFVDEVLHGDVFKESGVCPHQCWSETMVLQPVSEGLLGIKPDASNKTVAFTPALPADWDSLHVHNIQYWNGTPDIDMNRQNGKYHWTFSNHGTAEVRMLFTPPSIPQMSYSQWKLEGVSQPWQGELAPLAAIPLIIKDKITLEIPYSGGISVLPVCPDPKPGHASENIRIIRDELNGNQYEITVEAQGGTRHQFRVYAANLPGMVTNGTIVNTENNIYTIAVEFPENEPITRRTITISL
ncbi:MAG: hypothetical protein FJY10_04940 [Bacteroidetes bacterium]|nr:hypothetical protein [Bacteroidota bacterium]